MDKLIVLFMPVFVSGITLAFKKLFKMVFYEKTVGQVEFYSLCFTTIFSLEIFVMLNPEAGTYDWIPQFCKLIPFLAFLSVNIRLKADKDEIDALAGAATMLFSYLIALGFIISLVFNLETINYISYLAILALVKMLFSYFFKIISSNTSSVKEFVCKFYRTVSQIVKEQGPRLDCQMQLGGIGLLSIGQFSSCLYGVQYLLIGKKTKGFLFLVFGNIIEYFLIYYTSDFTSILYVVFSFIVLFDFCKHIHCLWKNQKPKHIGVQKVGI